MMRKLLMALPALVVLFSACSINNVEENEHLWIYFHKAHVNGCFALYDNGSGKFTIYNLPRYRDSAYPAGATFDIPELLIGLQTGQLKDEKAVLAYKDWVSVDPVNHTETLHPHTPLTIIDAFQSMGMDSSIVFQALAANIGMDTLKKWVDSLHYGNQVLQKDSMGVYNGSLQIPADQQLGLIKKLYFNQLPFFKRPHEIVRGLMKKESNTNYQLVYKTAVVHYADHNLGWVLGWVEENKHPYFFVLNFDDYDLNDIVPSVGIQLVKRILPSMGFFEGKK